VNFYFPFAIFFFRGKWVIIGSEVGYYWVGSGLLLGRKWVIIGSQAVQSAADVAQRFISVGHDAFFNQMPQKIPCKWEFSVASGFQTAGNYRTSREIPHKRFISGGGGFRIAQEISDPNQ
jgi:hypothetical protein